MQGAFIFGGDQTNKGSDNKEYGVLFLMDKDAPEDRVQCAKILVSLTSKMKLVFKTLRGLVDTGMSVHKFDV